MLYLYRGLERLMIKYKVRKYGLTFENIPNRWWDYLYGDNYSKALSVFTEMTLDFPGMWVQLVRYNGKEEVIRESHNPAYSKEVKLVQCA